MLHCSTDVLEHRIRWRNVYYSISNFDRPYDVIVKCYGLLQLQFRVISTLLTILTTTCYVIIFIEDSWAFCPGVKFSWTDTASEFLIYFVKIWSVFDIFGLGTNFPDLCTERKHQETCYSKFDRFQRRPKIDVRKGKASGTWECLKSAAYDEPPSSKLQCLTIPRCIPTPSPT